MRSQSERSNGATVYERLHLLAAVLPELCWERAAAHSSSCCHWPAQCRIRSCWPPLMCRIYLLKRLLIVAVLLWGFQESLLDLPASCCSTRSATEKRVSRWAMVAQSEPR